MRRLGVRSWGLFRKLAILRPFLAPEWYPVWSPMTTSSLQGLAGWGHKARTDQVRATAKQKALPYLALEDGFLRSLGLGIHHAPPLSLIMDPTGIYYDATQPSALENLLQNGGWETEELLDRARSGMASLRNHRLSKYNCQPDLDNFSKSAGTKPRILIVDQTEGDASIHLGLAGPEQFRSMLVAARQENPDAEIIIKTHPDVILGKKKGYLDRSNLTEGMQIVSASCNPWSLLEQVDKVYTVTSQLGFEALLAGKPVRCFGIPFYAGWGVTDDAMACARRTRHRSVEEIFAAAYLLYPRYLDPFTHNLCRFEDTVATLTELKHHNDSNQQPSVCFGMSWWKKRTVATFLDSTAHKTRFASTPRQALRLAQRHKARIVVWGRRNHLRLKEDCNKHGVPLACMEDGFLRSIGLGAGFTPAASLVLDSRGIYYDPREPSDLEHLLATTDFTTEILERAKALREAIVARNLTKYNVGRQQCALTFPNTKRNLFIPGQVDDDASVRLGSPVVRSNLELLQRVRSDNPEAFIVFRPHPDVEAGYRRGAIEDTIALQYVDVIERQTNSGLLSLLADETHTMTSLVGFEALLRGKTVVTYGQPFYSGWGLTQDRYPCPRRQRSLTLDQLVAATLILYPRYVDPATGLACSPERILDRLSATPIRPPFWRRLMQIGFVLANRVKGIR